MPHSRIALAQLAPGGDEVKVTGPMHFASGQPGTDVLSIHFVLVRGPDFAHGTTVVNAGDSSWSETVPVVGKLDVGDVVQGFGVAVLLSPEQAVTRTRIVQTLTWCEGVTIAPG